MKKIIFGVFALALLIPAAVSITLDSNEEAWRLGSPISGASVQLPPVK
ncbi:MAG: hypothetical protein ACRC5C_07715 [Bacilli bacterium]